MRQTLATIAIALMAACGGGSPGAPTTTPLPFTGRLALGDGRRFLTISGDSAACGDVRMPQSGTGVSVDVMGSTDSKGWMLRPFDGKGGSFEIHVERMLGTGMFGSVPLSGSARGYANDSSAEPFLSPIGPNGTTVTFAAAGSAPNPLTGQMPFGSLATGQFQGTVTFTRDGVTSSCPPGAVSWSLTNSSIE